MAVSPRFGIWIVGARGSVATTVQVGASALAAHLVPSIGLVSELADFSDVALTSFDSFVFGGHDITNVPVLKRAEALVDAGVFPGRVFEAVSGELLKADERVRPGYVRDGNESPREAVERLKADIEEFQRTNELADVIVVNLTSVEQPASESLLLAGLDELLAASNVPAGVVYAIAALEAGAGFIDFTPSAALQSAAVHELAAAKGLPLAGRDGKTGETLVKSALAPMFASRNLKVRSWAGTNILGGGDGAALANPDAAAAKLASKAGVLESVLGYPVDAPLHIDYVQDAGEWKTAWDHVAFDGFLGARMTLQFTWHGCDSSLAAPLVLDLVRFAQLARQRGESGVLGQLGFFFKDPMGADSHVLGQQFQQLRSWVLNE